jgi:thioredoxin-like negative regulator of GroEL
MAAQLLSALMQVTLLANGGNVSYADAYTASAETGKPMLVLIGADWCPHCVVMKNRVMPQLQQQGALEDISYVTINSDQQPALARQLMQGSSIPQVVLYYRTAQGWKRHRNVGAMSAGNVTQLIRQAVDAVAANPPKATKAMPVSDPNTAKAVEVEEKTERK